MIGAALGFLMFNLHPAKIFMGDTGSLFFGALAASAAISLGNPIIIIAIGGVYVIEGISVILQVAAVTEESKIPLFPFLVSRFFHAGLTAILLRIFLIFSKEDVSAFAFKSGNYEAVLSASAPAAVSLLCMASLFLLSIVPPKSEKEPLLSRIWNKFNIFWHSQT
jgi:UDP-N-acetylmuramyl pentapeptide phosphotransferase/UDP-N-acetylglucosamine-1-phosphate transferase